MTVFGYARVSTTSQELDIQIAQLKAAGCETILFEKESGVKDNRRELLRLLRRLHKGDVVIVPALDRLSRGGALKMLLALDHIKSKGATYKSLAEPWIEKNDLEELLAALQGWAARKMWEDLIRRTSAGRKAAREKGVKFGRKPKLTKKQQQVALARKLAGEPQKAIAKDYNVSCSTISRLRAAST